MEILDFPGRRQLSLQDGVAADFRYSNQPRFGRPMVGVLPNAAQQTHPAYKAPINECGVAVNLPHSILLELLTQPLLLLGQSSAIDT